jgi:predicted nucleic acid-binding protein
MRVYVDSSALAKRVINEPQSTSVKVALREHADAGDALVSSALAWVEVTRVIRQAAGRSPNDLDDLADAALAGILQQPIGPEVIALARRLAPPALLSLDAIHLASALLLDVVVLIAYDRRLLDAASKQGIRALSPASRV